MSKDPSRAVNIARNVAVSWAAQIVILIASFVNRVIFTRLLGAAYLGVDGLFASILNIFSLAELGLGSAIIYNLYKPVAEGDTEKAKQFLTFYSKAYNVIIIVILAAGLGMMPFLKRIVKADGLYVPVNLYVVYLLFLANTLSSYFLAHRQATLIINQRQSTVSAVEMTVKIAALLAEAILLLAFGNYYLYLITKVFWNYVQAIFISLIARKRYPELCEKSSISLDRDEKAVIKKNVSALFIRRVGSVVLLSTDNIIINNYINITMVGIYSNYTLIVSSVQALTASIFSSMTATIGNYAASKPRSDVEKLFRTYTFGIYMIYGFCSVCLYTLSNRFIRLVWGEDYLLPKATLMIIVWNFFLYGFQTAVNTFRDTTGLFVQGKYRSLVSSAVNVVLSVILVKYYDISGVIMGTVISRVTVSTWYDPYALYKHYFKSPVSGYYLRLIFYSLSTAAMCIIFDNIAALTSDGLAGFVISAAICLASAILLIAPFVKTEEFINGAEYAKRIFTMILSKLRAAKK